MSQLTFSIEGPGLAQLAAVAKATQSDLRRETAAAINDTAKRHKSQIAKQVATHVAIKQKTVKQGLTVTRASKARLGAKVTVRKTYRPGLHQFAARQTGAGVSYKIAKTSRSIAAGAFIATAKGGFHVFKRKGPGRYPLERLHGVSPWGAYVQNNLSRWSKELLEVALAKAVLRRQRAMVRRAMRKAAKK